MPPTDPDPTRSSTPDTTTAPGPGAPPLGDRPAVVLLSGGLDSATAAAIAIRDGFRPCALTIDYGQRHRHELAAAGRVARSLGVTEHRTMVIDLRAFGGSALTADIAVPKTPRTPATRDAIPVTYVPARNTIFLSLALAWAEVLGARDIFIGVNAVDYSGYPDCRPAFVEAFERLANLATRLGVEGTPIRIHAPLAEMTKAGIIRVGLDLGVDYGLTTSCYDPDDAGHPCRRCDACRLRSDGFREAGARDPAATG